jgi:5-formyltetrahydrofolate cyclo-ligase
MTDPSALVKAELRRLARNRRAAAHVHLCATAADALAGLAPGLGLAPGAVVAGYWPIGSEIDPRPLMAALAARGHPLALPVIECADRPLLFRSWAPGAPLDDGPGRTRHPMPDTRPCRPDVLLVPMLAFDRRGFRLGQGGGYYDRTLAALRSTGPVWAVGLAYAAQRVPDLPADPWDQAMDAIITETGLHAEESE